MEGGTGNRDTWENDAGSRAAGSSADSISPADAGFEAYGHRKTFHIDTGSANRKKVLITGADSYIGENFRRYAAEHYEKNFSIDTLDMRDSAWRETDFTSYDAVFHVAGIAHADVGKVFEKEEKKYYAVNTDLAIETARKAKAEGVKQFVFMSSMIIYGEAERIDEHTIPKPQNVYGNSKWLADKGIRKLSSEGFKVAVLRPPMIYGKGSKGNYPRLSRFVKKVPVFPAVKNIRSMLYIGNLCEFVCLLVLSGEGGIFFPQNKTYTQTSTMVTLIGKYTYRPVWSIRALNLVVSIAKRMSNGKIRKLIDKVFGNSYYDQSLSIYNGLNYQKYTLEESIRLTEGFRHRTHRSRIGLTKWIKK